MEKFVVLKNGTIYNLTSNKRLKITMRAGDRDIDVERMSITMAKFFSTMSKEEFMENWLLTLSLMLKNEPESNEDIYDEDNIDNDIDSLFKELNEDMEIVKRNVTGDDISNYVTAFVLGRMFGKFEKNTGAKISIEYLEIEIDEHEIIDDFIRSLSAEGGDITTFPEDDIFDGTAYFELDDFTED